MATSSIIVGSSNDASTLFENYELLDTDLEDIQYMISVETDCTGSSDNSSAYEDLIHMTTGMDESLSPTCYEATNLPYLTLENGLKDKLRFRYESEKGFHGGVKPIVKLHNCDDVKSIFIKASLYTCEENPTLHVFDLDGKHCKDGVCWQQVPRNGIVKFPSLSIIKKKKEEVLTILKDKKKFHLAQLNQKIDNKKIEKEVQEEVKRINLNSVCLCFEAFDYKKDSLCNKIFSNPISNQKSTVYGELNITRLSSCSGKSSGKDEIIILCNKIRKDDIEIHFYEKDDNGDVIWMDKGEFIPSDVHFQVAIPFKTPPYKENVEKKVWIELHRKSDEKSGEPREFTYIPVDDCVGNSLKRKRGNTSVELSTLQNLPSTSTELTDSLLLSDCDTYLLSEYSGILNPSLTGQDFDFFKDYSLPLTFMAEDPYPEDHNANVDHVNMEAVIGDFDSLTLSQTNNCNSPKKVKSVKCNIPDEERIRDLKNGVISILQSCGNNSFLEYLPLLMKIKDENANTILHLAIMEKSENLMLLIRILEVTSGMLTNKANRFLMTPLHLATSKGLWKVVRILMISGADPNIKNRDGDNCVHLAVKYNFPLCLREILFPTILEKGVKKSVNPKKNDLNYEGLAPLHISIMNNSKSCTEALIEAKADINVMDGRCGRTPLHIAYNHAPYLVQYLLSQPAIKKDTLDFKGCIAASNPNAIECCKEPAIGKDTLDFKGCVSASNPKAIECCIEMASDISSSGENSCLEDEEVPANIQRIDDVMESKLCKILDCDGLWKKLGAYIVDEKELSVIEALDSTPTKALLNRLKKLHGDNYSKKLRYILSGTELKDSVVDIL